MRLVLLVTLAGMALAAPAAAQTATQTGPGAAPRPPAVSAPAPSLPPSQGVLIDINSASREELQTLKGIGTARADAIVKARPYKGKDELHRRGIVPQSVYDEIKDRIVARQS